ncbi:MAG: TIGR02453 family protein [Bauldia sp.]|nr:TIGR02453 family protein [Bauldia sp.]
MARFRGFGPDAIGFFRALGFHQNREWFQENRALYEEQVKGPTLALVEDLSERFEKAGIPLRGGKATLFRINRDVRFSKDKRPYQTHAGAVLTPTGTKDGQGLVYLHIAPAGTKDWDGSPEGCFMAAGFHQPEPADLTTIRTTIQRDPKAFQALEAKLAKAKLALGTDGQLTRVPRGFEAMKGSPVEGAIRMKSFIVEDPIDEALVTSPKLADRIFTFTERAKPLLDYGWRALGTAIG